MLQLVQYNLLNVSHATFESSMLFFKIQEMKLDLRTFSSQDAETHKSGLLSVASNIESSFLGSMWTARHCLIIDRSSMNKFVCMVANCLSDPNLRSLLCSQFWSQGMTCFVVKVKPLPCVQKDSSMSLQHNYFCKMGRDWTSSILWTDSNWGEHVLL